MSKIPWQIKDIITALGGFKLNGAITYTGGRNFQYKMSDDPEAEKSGTPSKVTPEGLIDYEMGLQFSPNSGSRGWKFVVVIEPSDTFSVYLWRPSKSKKVIGVVMAEYHNVYVDMLQGLVESVYDEFVKKEMGGFIPL